MNDLRKILETKKPQYLDWFKELIALDTQVIGHGIDGGKEQAGQRFMVGLLEKFGANDVVVDQMRETIIEEAIERYDEGNPGHEYEERWNVYGTFRGSETDQYRSILFNGHIDTMPPGDESMWTHGPWNPVVYDGKVNGLGATDMKGGLLAPLLAVDLLKAAGRKPKGDVKIISVVDEEGGGNGSIQAAMQGVSADAAVVCEPTNRGLILAHMGFVFFSIRTEGLAVHSGDKFKGVSAIEKMGKIIAALHELEHVWLAKYRHQLLPSPSLNVGVIEGGSAGSTVAADCTIKICVHYIPGQMTKKQVEDEIIQAVRLIEASDPWMADHPATIDVYQAGGGFEMDPAHVLVDTFKDVYRQATDEMVPIVGSPAGCDSRIWCNIVQIPTIQYGPGRLEECHAIDEFLTLDDFWHAILTYAGLIDAWCNQRKE